MDVQSQKKAPKGDSRANGLAERAVQSFESMLRTIILFLESRLLLVRAVPRLRKLLEPKMMLLRPLNSTGCGPLVRFGCLESLVERRKRLPHH